MKKEKNKTTAHASLVSLVLLLLLMTASCDTRLPVGGKSIVPTALDDYSYFSAPDLNEPIPGFLMFEFKSRTPEVEFLQIHYNGLAWKNNSSANAVLSIALRYGDIQKFLAGETVYPSMFPHADSLWYASYGENLIGEQTEHYNQKIARVPKSIQLESWDDTLRMSVELGPPLDFGRESHLGSNPATIHIKGSVSIGCNSAPPRGGTVISDINFSEIPFCIQVADWGVRSRLD